MKRPGVVLFIALFLPVTLAVVNFELVTTGMGGTWMKSVYCFGKIAQFSLPVIWTGLIRREPWLMRPPNRRGLGEGFLFGILVGATLAAMYHFHLKLPGELLGPDSEGASVIRLRMTTLGYRSLPVFLSLAVSYSIVHGGLEEYYWRWFVFGQAGKIVSEPAAIAVSSLGFTLHHVVILGNFFGFDSPWTWFLCFCTGVGGAYWCRLYRRSDSIWGPWLGHAVIDGAIFVVAFDIVFS